MDLHASCWPDMAGLIDSAHDIVRELADDFSFPHEKAIAFFQKTREATGDVSVERVHEYFRRVLQIIGDADNAQFRVWCVDFLMGTNLFGGKSETDIALRFGYTRASASATIKDIQRQLGLPAPRGGKRDAVSRTYARRATRAHAKGVAESAQKTWLGPSHFQFL